MVKENLEKIVDSNTKGDIDLKRIALTTLGYGVVGAFCDDGYVFAPITASIGLSASIYDEFKQTGMKLTTPAAGIFVGSLIGSLIGTLLDADANQYITPILPYAGAVLGGALGFYKSYHSRKNN